MRMQRGIPPNFGVKEFATEEETVSFLRNLGFKLLCKRATYDLWETTKAPKKRAISLERERGDYVAKQLPFNYDANASTSILPESKLRTSQRGSKLLRKYESKPNRSSPYYN